MAVKYVIDAHALLWFLAGSALLGFNAKVIMDNSASELILPSIALAEACWVLQKQKFDLSPAKLFDVIDSDPRITVYPLDRAVVQRSLDLKQIHEMHDRQIAATALVIADRGEKVKILTCDKNILDFGLVEITW